MGASQGGSAGNKPIHRMRWKFIAQEYLPGKNVAVHTLWKKGELIVAQARERLEYIYPYLLS